MDLDFILENARLTDEQIDKILEEKSEDNKSFTKRIEDTLKKYKDESTVNIARIIGKHCNRESLKNIKRRREIRREVILEYLKNLDIYERLNNTKRICLILDNYSSHKSAFIKKIANILNIVLIFLPPYSPHLNPIEQIWRMMKRVIRAKDLISKDYMDYMVEITFYDCVEINLKYFDL